MILLDQADAKRRIRETRPQREIAKDAGAVDTSAEHENVEIRFLELADLLLTEAGHSTASLEYPGHKNESRTNGPASRQSCATEFES
jgi:hypothetical protein